MSSLHQGSLLTKPRCKPFPDATPVSDCAVCPSHSQGRGVSPQSGFTPPHCSACCHQFWSLPFQNLHVCVFASLGMKRFHCPMKCSFIPVGATVATTYSLTVKQEQGLAECRLSKIGFTWAYIRYWNILFFEVQACVMLPCDFLFLPNFLTGCPSPCLLCVSLCLIVVGVSACVFLNAHSTTVVPSALFLIVSLYFLLHLWLPGGWLEVGLSSRHTSTVSPCICLGLKGQSLNNMGLKTAAALLTTDDHVDRL